MSSPHPALRTPSLPPAMVVALAALVLALAGGCLLAEPLGDAAPSMNVPIEVRGFDEFASGSQARDERILAKLDGLAAKSALDAEPFRRPTKSDASAERWDDAPPPPDRTPPSPPTPSKPAGPNGSAAPVKQDDSLRSDLRALIDEIKSGREPGAKFTGARIYVSDPPRVATRTSACGYCNALAGAILAAGWTVGTEPDRHFVLTPLRPEDVGEPTTVYYVDGKQIGTPIEGWNGRIHDYLERHPKARKPAPTSRGYKSLEPSPAPGVTSSGDATWIDDVAVAPLGCAGGVAVVRSNPVATSPRSSSCAAPQVHFFRSFSSGCSGPGPNDGGEVWRFAPPRRAPLCDPATGICWYTPPSAARSSHPDVSRKAPS